MAQPEVKSTILYVEDNPDNRMLVRRILMAENYRLFKPRMQSALIYWILQLQI